MLKDSNWIEMMKLFKPYSYKNGEFIYGSSDIPAEINFITSGVVRSFKMEENGRDFTWAFYYLNDEVMEHRMIADVCMALASLCLGLLCFALSVRKSPIPKSFARCLIF